MTKYILRLSKESKKFLKKTDKITEDRILEALGKLSVNPFDYEGATKITGTENEYRIRIGKYRVIYEIVDDLLIIMVFNIDSRGGIYKRM